MLITEVEVGPLREAFKASGLRPVDVARALGWTAPYGPGGRRHADGPRVSRALGLLDAKTGPRTSGRRRHVSYATAVALVKAMGADPVELGL